MPSKPSLPLQRKSTFSLLKSSCAPKSRDFSTPAAFHINSAGFRQNYCKKAAPQEKSREAIFRRKRNSGNRICRGSCNVERAVRQTIRRWFPCSSQYAKPGRHLLGYSGHIGIACCSPMEALHPQGKTGRLPVFYKMEGRENSLPGTELFDCADLYASTQGSDDRSQNRVRFCSLRVLITQNSVCG